MAEKPSQRDSDPELADIEELGRIERRRALDPRGSASRSGAFALIVVASLIVALAIAWAAWR